MTAFAIGIGAIGWILWFLFFSQRQRALVQVGGAGVQEVKGCYTPDLIVVKIGHRIKSRPRKKKPPASAYTARRGLLLMVGDTGFEPVASGM